MSFKASETLLGIETRYDPSYEKGYQNGGFKASETLLGIETLSLQRDRLARLSDASKPLKPF